MKKHLRNHGGALLGRRAAGTIPSFVQKYMPDDISGIGSIVKPAFSAPNYDGVVSHV